MNIKYFSKQHEFGAFYQDMSNSRKTMEKRLKKTIKQKLRQPKNGKKEKQMNLT